MLGRFGEAQEPQQLLDRRQMASMVVSLVALGVGLVLQYAVHARPWSYDALYLAGAVLLGGPIVVSAIKGLVAGHSNVDELVALALIASCIGGYYLEADVVAILMVAGSMFEQRASLRARRAIEQLLKLAPEEAVLLGDNGGERVVAAHEIKAGDRVLVRAGSRVPADGVVERGSSDVDQSALTGESVPVYRQMGETALAGSLALNGSLTIRVTRAGENSTVGQIIRIVRDAEHHQTPAVRIVDRWTKYYTPLILGIAGVTIVATWAWGGWSANALKGAWKSAVAVLVVGCPCAIVLATPTAIVAAMGRAARLGVLVKNGGVLERAAAVDSIVFDKTGTLTTGRHRVVSVIPAEELAGIEEVRGLCPAVAHSLLGLHRAAPTGAARDGAAGPDRLLRLAAAVEYHSDHPFARAIREHAREQGVEFEPATDVREIPGVGVQGRVEGQPVVAARPEYVARQVRNACAVAGTMIRPLEGYSAIAVQVGGVYAGVVLLSDTLRPAAREAVEELRAAGVRDLSVLSGDHAGAVRVVADQLKLDSALGGLMPAEKARQIQALRREGRVVAFVGDGMNDGPALAVADVGVAMGTSGTDIALQTADIVLLNDRIELLGVLFNLSRKVARTIHGNLYFGLGLNLAAIVLASSGVLSPMLGALVHNLGSVFVVGNSARLARFGKVAAAAPEGSKGGERPMRKAA